MDVDAGHLRTIRKKDLCLSRIGSSSNQINNDLRNLWEDKLYWWVSSIHAWVERSGTGLTLWYVGGTQEVRELLKEIVSIIFTEINIPRINSNVQYLPRSNVVDFSSFRIRDF